jgi:hypothetical protein
MMTRVAKSGEIIAVAEALLVAGSLWASGSDWDPIPSLKLKSIAVIDSETVYGVGLDSMVLRRSGDTWTVVPGSPAMEFVAGSPDLLIGVDTDGRLLRRSGDTWTAIDPPSAGSFTRGGVDSTLAIYLLETTGVMWQGDPVQGGELYAWRQVDDGIVIIDISVSGDLIFAIDQEHQLLRRTGDTWSVDQTAPSLDSVSAGDGEIFGVSGGDVFRRSGDGWLSVDGPAMRRVSVGNDGTTYGLGPRPDPDTNNLWIYIPQ